MTSSHRWQRLVPLAALCIVACTDAPEWPGRAVIARTVPRGAIQPVVQALAPAADGTQPFVVRVLSRVQELAAYQGVLRYDPDAVEVVSVRPAAAVQGSAHLVNADPASRGVIRFAVYAPARLATEEAFTLVVRVRGGGVPVLSITLDVAGTETGLAIEPARLRPSDGLHDLTGTQRQ